MTKVTFDKFLEEAKPQAGEKIFIAICMNAKGNTLTGVRLFALLHAVQTMSQRYNIPYQFYIEVNKVDNLPNPYYAEWQVANKTFLDRAGREFVQTLDVFQSTKEFKEIKERHAEYRLHPDRTVHQEKMLDNDVIEYSKKHPNSQDVREHILDVTASMLGFHMKSGDDFAGMKNYLFYEGPLTTIQGNALQVAKDLGLQERGLMHFRFNPQGLVTQFKTDRPEQFNECLAIAKAEEAAGVAFAKAAKGTASVAEEKIVPGFVVPAAPTASPALSVSSEDSDSSRSMSVSPQFTSVSPAPDEPPAILEEPTVTTPSASPKSKRETGTDSPPRKNPKKGGSPVKTIRPPGFQRRVSSHSALDLNFVVLRLCSTGQTDVAVEFATNYLKKEKQAHFSQQEEPCNTFDTNQNMDPDYVEESKSVFASSAFMPPPATTGVVMSTDSVYLHTASPASTSVSTSRYALLAAPRYRTPQSTSASSSITSAPNPIAPASVVMHGPRRGSNNGP